VIAPRRSLVVGAPLLATLVMVLGLAGCADDANDQAVQARRPAASPWELRRRTTGPDPEGSTSATSSPPTTPPVSTQSVAPTGVVVTVIALDNSFRPAVVEIAVGDEVLWENRGLNEHNVLRVEGGGWGVEVEDFQPGDVYSHVFTEPGEYRYYCSIHGSTDVGMVGTVLVTG
jgi:plastocyanin